MKIKKIKTDFGVVEAYDESDVRDAYAGFISDLASQFKDSVTGKSKRELRHKQLTKDDEISFRYILSMTAPLVKGGEILAANEVDVARKISERIEGYNLF